MSLNRLIHADPNVPDPIPLKPMNVVKPPTPTLE